MTDNKRCLRSVDEFSVSQREREEVKTHILSKLL